MFMNAIRIEPARVSGLLAAAERAARAIPPAFPLDATVAVNPFLGQSGEDLATASARLARPGPITVDEILHAIDFFSSPPARNITGETLYFGGPL